MPVVSRYAQEGRPYAVASLCVAAGAYGLVRAVQAETGPKPRRAVGWWTGYAVAVGAAGIFNLLALLSVAAFAVTVVLWRPPRTVLLRWAAASTAGIRDGINRYLATRPA
uniref:hypothetical protein n=1 Tax=Streptomyces sp. F12 TaxID=1436084 RepID=UPI0037DA5159